MNPLPTALNAIACAANNVEAAIRITDQMNRLQDSVSLLMVMGNLHHAAQTLRVCKHEMEDRHV